MAHTIDAVRTRRSLWRRKGGSLRAERLGQFYIQHRQQITQTFWVDPLQEITLKGKNAMQFHIPALAFEDQWGLITDGKVKVEIIELTKKSAIILADRATTAGNNLLETGGAFYFGASQNNNPLRLGAPVEVRIPISNRVTTPGYMAIFGGRDQSNGFDWVSDPRGTQANLKVDSIEQTFNVTLRQPGWINCDHYYRLRQQQHYNLRIASNTDLAEQEVFLIYRSINTVTKMRVDESGYFYFPRPVPLPSVIYSLGSADGQLYQGFHPIPLNPYRRDARDEPQPADLQDLPMKPVLQEDIQSNLEEQIRFWDKAVTNQIEERHLQRRRQVARYRRWLGEQRGSR